MSIKSIFTEVVTGNKYDPDAVSKHILKMFDAQVCAWQLPSLEKDYVEKHHVGGSLQYAMYLFFKMRRHSIESYIAVHKVKNTVTDTEGNYLSVFYFMDGEGFFADPAKSVKVGKISDYYKIPKNDFIKNHGTTYLYDPFGDWGDHLFFTSFFSLPVQILEKE